MKKYYDYFISYIEQIETEFDWFHNVVFLETMNVKI